MSGKIHKFGIGVILALVLSLVIVVVSYSAVGVTSEAGTGGVPLPVYDLSAVPESVVEDATRLATELFGDYQEKCNDFVNQLLAIYSKVEDKDFVVIFNPGGLGHKSIEATPGWCSIFAGIESELAGLGYTSLFLEHLRADESWLGCLAEFVEGINGYPSKAKDLACRLEFITTHVPDLRVIVAGESTGTVICDRAMNILEDNPQVYSIQTGPPFWHENIMLDKTLLLTNNGIIPDSYSQGDFGAIVWGNLKYRLRLSQPEDAFGTTPHYVGAPGHDYWWHYPEVCSQISNFLDESFGLK